MNQPSEHSLGLAHELSFYVHRGLTRGDMIHEMAEIIDESNRDLVEAVSALLLDAERHDDKPASWYLNRVKRAFLGHEPTHESLNGQSELFLASTNSGDN